MAYATQTTGNRDLPLRLVVLIDGIEQVMVSKTVSPASLVSSRTQLQTLLFDSVSAGEERIDVLSRAVTGGSLTFRLRDDADETLLGLFGFRESTPRTYLGTTNYARTGAEVTISVDSTSSFAASGTVHINAEAISYTGKTATTFTGCTRGAYGTKAGDHRQGDAAGTEYLGALVTAVPQSWRGRRVTLKAGYEDADGTMADLVDIGTYRILEPPLAIEDGNTYEVLCGPISDYFREGRCYVGPIDAEMVENQSGIRGDTLEMREHNGQSLFLDAGTRNAHALVKTNQDTYRLSKVESVSGTTIVLKSTDLLQPGAAELNEVSAAYPYGSRGSSIRHVVRFANADPVDVTLMLLTSVEGTLTNGDWDVLPGVTATEFGVHQWRMGAGIDEANINYADPDGGSDTGSIRRLAGGAIRWRFVLNELLEVSDLLREFCVATGSYWYVDTNGKLSFERLRDIAPPTIVSQSVTLDDSTVITPAPTLRFSEANLAHTVRLKANYEPIQGEHGVSITVVDWELRERYPESAQEIEAESKFMRVRTAGFALSGRGQSIGGNGTSTVESVAAQLRRAQNLNAFGEAFVDLECAWNASQLVPGEFVDLNLARTPDTKGGRLTSGRGMIVSRRLNFQKMTVDLGVRVMEAARVIAPVGVIASVSTTTNPDDTWVLDTTDDTVDPDLTSPVDAFAATWQIMWYDRSAGTVETMTVSSVDQGTNTLVVSAQPAATPVAGDYFWPVVDQATPAAVSTLDEDDFLWTTYPDGTTEDSRYS